MRTSECWELFSKNLASTRALLTTEATDVEHQMNRTSTIGKIMDHAAVSALYPRRESPTIGTHCGWRCCTQGEHDFISNIDLQNLEILIKRFGKNGHAFNSDREGY